MENLETKRYKLRKPQMKDAEEIYEKWGDDKDKAAEYKEHRAYKNISETRALLNAAIMEAESGVPFYFAEAKETKEIIGYIKVSEYSYKNKICRVNFYFLDKWREDLSPEEVLSELFSKIFEKGNIETIVIRFYDRNEEDTKKIEKLLNELGMKKEGILRNRMINSEGKKVDEYAYSILKEEWKALDI